ncbi:hypothetical protein VP01_140g2 [Puccinia sorghi]|uniref:Uncharacterized protein n=1 Tax=Puccinia sorghi TaxID=27349 RepID=A0A0L6VL10_9BASI|nr:hypothetical protein VP01_140g2 [Puccinia sorghi]
MAKNVPNKPRAICKELEFLGFGVLPLELKLLLKPYQLLDKMTSLLKPHSIQSLNDQAIPLGDSNNSELTMLMLAKMDSKLWSLIKDRFTSSQLSNWARIFNDSLQVKFQEDAMERFVANIKVSIKKMIDCPSSSKTCSKISKGKIMHSDKDFAIKFLCNCLIQLNNKFPEELVELTKNTTEEVLTSKKAELMKFHPNGFSE